MINALVKGKFKEGHKEKEDTLTSAVFDYLLLLPSSLIWEIIKKSNILNTDMPSEIGDLIHIDFWPHWSTKKIADKLEGGNNIFIEPDLFIETDNYYLIIEAKRYDDNQQSRIQWNDQIYTFYEKYKEEIIEKPLLYFAIGGLWSEHPFHLDIPETDNKQAIFKIKWLRLLEQCKEKRIELEKLNTNSTCKMQINILKNIELGMKHHGYYLPDLKWLSTLKTETKTINESINHIKQWKIIQH